MITGLRKSGSDTLLSLLHVRQTTVLRWYHLRLFWSHPRPSVWSKGNLIGHSTPKIHTCNDSIHQKPHKHLKISKPCPAGLMRAETAPQRQHSKQWLVRVIVALEPKTSATSVVLKFETYHNSSSTKPIFSELPHQANHLNQLRDLNQWQLDTVYQTTRRSTRVVSGCMHRAWEVVILKSDSVLQRCALYEQHPVSIEYAAARVQQTKKNSSLTYLQHRFVDHGLKRWIIRRTSLHIRDKTSLDGSHVWHMTHLEFQYFRQDLRTCSAASTSTAVLPVPGGPNTIYGAGWCAPERTLWTAAHCSLFRSRLYHLWTGLELWAPCTTQNRRNIKRLC